MGDDVVVLHVGGESRQFEAHLELASPRLSTTADRAIVGFVKLMIDFHLAIEKRGIARNPENSTSGSRRA